jgi:hypothetical protein
MPVSFFKIGYFHRVVVSMWFYFGTELLHVWAALVLVVLIKKGPDFSCSYFLKGEWASFCEKAFQEKRNQSPCHNMPSWCQVTSFCGLASCVTLHALLFQVYLKEKQSSVASAVSRQISWSVLFLYHAINYLKFYYQNMRNQKKHTKKTKVGSGNICIYLYPWSSCSSVESHGKTWGW